MVEGVHNGESPAWLRELLEAAGIRPLGLLVDITNFVMLETGEPMHAFDRRRINGNHISVRSAGDDETLTTLDDRELSLSSDDMIISDDTAALALAGIIGGQDSAVAADTDTIVLEAATFRAAAIRRSRIRHGITTDSASRFEKHLPVELTAVAINRAIALLRDLCPGCRVSGRFSAGDGNVTSPRIAFDGTALTRYVGMELATNDQLTILERLGFTVHECGEVSVPWWRRRDVEEITDLVEEVARIHGYHHLRPEVPRLPASVPHANPLRQAEHAVRRSRVLRMSLLPTLAEAAARNRRYFDGVTIYEIGKRYGVGIGRGITVDETLMVTGCCAAADDQTPFYRARDAALQALSTLGHHATVAAATSEHPAAVSGRHAELRIGKTVIGQVAELPANLASLADCNDPVAWFAINLEELVADCGHGAPIAFQAPSRFQQVDR
ncbi:MAG: phenylalanine--tRNA ligase beta subunit-related protein, partial [Planctomycetota bacterium]